jgi:SpoVK/Ycf46/Vps4 family AAA+-type ATPase
MLKDTKLAPEFHMPALAELSEGQSGSDLKEMCRNAAMVPVREYVRGATVNQELLAKGQLEVRAVDRLSGALWLMIAVHPGIQFAAIDS